MKHAKKTIQGLMAITLAFAVTFTSMTCLSGDIAVYAATKPAKVKGVTAKPVNTTTIKLSWKKCTTKGVKGYAVYRRKKGGSWALVKRVARANKLTFKDAGLTKNTNYEYRVRAYKKKVKKSYYNSKTRKWQKKKPSAKYWKACPKGTFKGKKTRSVTKYTFGYYSAIRKAKTKNTSTSSGSSSGGTSGSGSSVVSGEELKMTYGGVTVHTGQTWTNNLKSSLISACGGNHNEYTRAEAIKLYDSNGISTGYYDEKIYLFGTKTYNPFLAVHVAGDRILYIVSNGSTLGSYNGTIIKRGESAAQWVEKELVTPCPSKAMHGGVVLIRFYSPAQFGRNYNHVGVPKTERDIAFHYLNAVRVASGKPIVKRSGFLDGCDLATGKDQYYTGNVTNMLDETTYINNLRYGAQAWAETVKLNGNTGVHSAIGKVYGPCGLNAYDQDGDGVADVPLRSLHALAYYTKTGEGLPAEKEVFCTSSGGDDAIFSWGHSATSHWKDLMDNNGLGAAVYVGIGWYQGSCIIRPCYGEVAL